MLARHVNRSCTAHHAQCSRGVCLFSGLLFLNFSQRKMFDGRHTIPFRLSGIWGYKRSLPTERPRASIKLPKETTRTSWQQSHTRCRVRILMVSSRSFSFGQRGRNGGKGTIFPPLDYIFREGSGVYPLRTIFFPLLNETIVRCFAQNPTSSKASTTRAATRSSPQAPIYHKLNTQ